MTANTQQAPRVLIIDDERDFGETLADQCALEGYDASFSDSGQEGLLRCQSMTPDIVLLDLNLPDIDGADVIKALREFSKVPLIVLSGRETTVDRILALELGADDYMSKPFESLELMARIKAHVRRSRWMQEEYGSGKKADARFLDLDFPWQVDFGALCIRSKDDEREISLTSREISMLKSFAQHGDTAVSKEVLLSAIGYPRNYEHGPLEVCLSRLKSKLTKSGVPYPIQAVRGVGYRLHTTGEN